MKILYCGYRSWADEAYDKLIRTAPSLWHDDGGANQSSTSSYYRINDLKIQRAKTNEEFLEKARAEQFDVIMLAGWSWKVPDDILAKSFVVGMHPSDLPAYAGGSPIQNQILDGIEETNASLFILTSEFDAGPVLAKTPISLAGNMSAIFEELRRVTVKLFVDFLREYPTSKDVRVISDVKEVVQRKRRKPAESRLSREMFVNSFNGPVWSCKELYDFIRCREDPYPNAYIEDETGRLEFKLVKFTKKVEEE